MAQKIERSFTPTSVGEVGTRARGTADPAAASLISTVWSQQSYTHQLAATVRLHPLFSPVLLYKRLKDAAGTTSHDPEHEYKA